MNQPFISLDKSNLKKWYLIDAKDQNLGRLSSYVARILIGKNKSTYTPFLDSGDFVIIINANKILVTGKKENQKIYFRHSGRPGGSTIETFRNLKSRIPTRIIEKAIKGMLPKGPLGRQMYSKLKVYEENAHPHQAQKPEMINI
uniref:ribosomal protein L13 n=1 Tax=Glaucosphaera vacuolata TaxID=38265 RepID=UPI001FCDCC7C|nr:ribosomal protein L13 [Glaucosphaera vacuolata]UNJ18618.1 ribosomal protein L13 [Glaucosphaera vacuolata]